MNNVERFDELYNINTMTTQKGSFFRLQKILFENEELKELSLEAKNVKVERQQLLFIDNCLSKEYISERDWGS